MWQGQLFIVQAGDRDGWVGKLIPDGSEPSRVATYIVIGPRDPLGLPGILVNDLTAWMEGMQERGFAFSSTAGG